MKKLNLLRWMMIVVVAVILAACGGGSSDGAAKDVTVNLDRVAWAAYDDGNGWQKISDSDLNSSFVFEPTDKKYGIAVKCEGSGMTSHELKIYQMTLDDINNFTNVCPEHSSSPHKFGVSGTISNIPYKYIFVSTGDDATMTATYSYGETNYCEDNSYCDVMAISVKSGLQKAKMAIGRDIYFDSDKVVNMDMDDAFDLTKYNFNVSGTHIFTTGVNFRSKNNAFVASGGMDMFAWYKIPNNKAVSGDKYVYFARDDIDSKNEKILFEIFDAKGSNEDLEIDMSAQSNAAGSMSGDSTKFENITYTPSPTAPENLYYWFKIEEGFGGGATDSTWHITVSSAWIGTATDYQWPNFDDLGVEDKFNLDDTSNLYWQIGDLLSSVKMQKMQKIFEDDNIFLYPDDIKFFSISKSK